MVHEWTMFIPQMQSDGDILANDMQPNAKGLLKYISSTPRVTGTLHSDFKRMLVLAICT